MAAFFISLFWRRCQSLHGLSTGDTAADLLVVPKPFFLEMTEAPIWAVPMDVAPHFAGIAGGIMSTAAGLAATMSPLAFGALVDWTGSYSLPFIVSIGLAGVGIVLSFFMRPDRPIAVVATIKLASPL